MTSLLQFSSRVSGAPRVISNIMFVGLALSLASCAQTAPPPPVQAAAPVMPQKPAILRGSSDDMDATITRRTGGGDLSGLKIWRDNATMHVAFQITNKSSQALRFRTLENWSDKSGKPIDQRLDQQSIVIAPNFTQTISVSGPVPQARTLVLELKSE